MFAVQFVNEGKILFAGIASVIDWERLKPVLVEKTREGRKMYVFVPTQIVQIVIADLNMPETGGFEPAAGTPEIRLDGIIVRDHAESGYGWRAKQFVAKHYLCKPCAKRTVQAANDETFGKPNHRELIRRVMDYVEAHLQDEALTLSRLARKVFYMNPDYLGRLFRLETGMKFSEYVMQARIKRAIHLLQSAETVRISELAERVGFGNNPQYFSVAFKKHTGTTPKEYARLVWPRQRSE
ncbi:MAG TPA: helix-turn-helix domain-containing protein [Bacilli bacterium]